MNAVRAGNICAGRDGFQYRCRRGLRRRFSLNSDEDEAFFYSSPEDEEDFLSQEFLKAYASICADRLVTMSKSELIGEYIQMEERIDALEKRLERVRRDGERPAAASPEVAERAAQLKRDIRALELENRELRRENRELRRAKDGGQKEEEEDVNSVTSSSCCLTGRQPWRP